MRERLCGLETEYAFTALGAQGKRLNQEEAVEWLMERARTTLPHLPDMHSHGMFLQNGSRFYVDHGLHPEVSTAECTNPWDVVRYALAGEQILLRLADDLAAQGEAIATAQFFRCNIDYSGANTTWGCHESYLHQGDPTVFPHQLIPHLVSRIIYTGAGGFNSLSPGITFTLSPRVPHLLCAVSKESTHHRGIFHTKDEALSSNGYHRLHLICGESLCSQIATWLKVGTTALIVALIEAGLCPGEAVALRSPLTAMRQFADDPTSTAVVRSMNGRALTALGIQHHYLALAEAHLHDACMPSWAEAVCRQWRSVLNRLEHNPSTLVTVLDWPMKLALYKEQVRRYGFTWEALPDWTQLVVRVQQALERTECRERSITVELVCGSESPIADEAKRLTPFMHEKGLTWDGVRSFLMLRQELCELDMRFGQLGTGIFAMLDREGVLAHRLSGIENIELAVTTPPADGRARLRGAWVQRLAGERARYVCDWQGVWDRREGRVLDLSDPFATEEQWRGDSEGEEAQVRWYTRLQDRMATLRQSLRPGLRVFGDRD